MRWINRDVLAPAVAAYLGPVLVAVLAVAATLATLAPDAGGPGITCDELYHVVYGKRLVMAIRQQGLTFFTPARIAQNFPWTPDGPPVHPPLGNWILGWTHHLFDTAPDEETAVSIVAARFAPALAFGLLVLMVGAWTSRRDGSLAGTTAAAATALVPRLFAHAHFAALDMFTTLFVVAAILAIIEAEARGRWWHFALAGVLWGLAMLTRLHGVLLLPPVAIWMMTQGRGKRGEGRGGASQGDGSLLARLTRRVLGRPEKTPVPSSPLSPLCSLLLSAVVTLFVGWPWLWMAPLAHLRQYLGTGLDRQAIHVFYAGQVWPDYGVPWHYPLVMFLATLPLGLLVLGAAGIWARVRSFPPRRGDGLVLGTLAWFLLVFAWPGVPVYDGVRLFLMVFPLWAILVGAGAQWVVDHPIWKARPAGVRVVVGLVIAGQAVGIVVYHPCQLSHYSLLVGGLPGAERLGFEVTYWGDAVTEPLLAEAARRAPGEPIAFGPSLAPFQAAGIAICSPALAKNDVRLAGWQQNSAAPPPGCRLGIFYHRKADLAQIPETFWNAEPIAVSQKRGVWLSRLVWLRGGYLSTGSADELQ